MKIGILTFHRAENFGAVLQCYALQSYLESLGHKVEIIDYRCKAIEEVYYLFDLRSLFRLNIVSAFISYFKRILLWKDRLEKKRGYVSFRDKYLHLTKSIYKIKEDLGYDAYITGSDQVWNTSLLHGFNRIYFLDFPTSKEAKKISYAVSSEQQAIKNLYLYKDKLCSILNQFNSISVREDNFAKELSNYTSTHIEVCVDPTFLIPKEKYLQLAIKPKEQNYILVYHMAEIPEGSTIADQLAEATGYSIIEIHAHFKKRKDPNRHKENLGPLELLGYIAHANYIITSSFHGLAFSLILQKNFCIVSRPNNNRLLNILKLLNLENRIISKTNSIPTSNIDYSIVTSKINKWTTQSKEYLIKSL